MLLFYADVLGDVKVDMDVKYTTSGLCSASIYTPFLIVCTLEHPKITQYVPVVPVVEWYYRKNSDYPFVNLFDDPEHRYLGVEKQQSCTRVSKVNESSYYQCEFIKGKTCPPRYNGHYKCEIIADLFDGERRVYNASKYLGV